MGKIIENNRIKYYDILIRYLKKLKKNLKFIQLVKETTNGRKNYWQSKYIPKNI